MKHICITFLSLLLLLGLFRSASAAPSMAFGYLANESNDADFEYLETIFPNSFANSITNIFKVKVIKPNQINKRLSKYKLQLQRYYPSYEVPELMEKIESDFFIFGKFVPMPENNILIVLNFYEKGSNKLFTFSNIGKMESEIFKLVDRITQILINLLDTEQFYKTGVIKKNSQLAFISNLDGADLNMLYYTFMDNGYTLSYMQGNTVYNHTSEDLINTFKFIYSENNSYDIITDKRKVKLLHGTWSGPPYQEKVNNAKRLYNYYDFKYNETKQAILEKISRTFNGSIDYLFIIGFNKRKNKAWLRCINMATRDLIWMQSNIKGRNVSDISQIIAKKMTEKMKLPFENK